MLGFVSAVLISAAISGPPKLKSNGHIKIERIFGPEVPTGDYKHPASMAELDNGDLYLVYYGGKGEYAPNTGVFGSRLPHGKHAGLDRSTDYSP